MVHLVYMKYLESIERKLEPPTERKKILEDIFSSSMSLSYSLSTSLQNHCDKIFDKWMEELDSNGLCKCKDDLFLHKIPYTAASGYKDEEELILNRPGIYLWGRDNIPRYIGKTEISFEERLFNRYISRNKDTNYKHPTQCSISEILRVEYKSVRSDFEEKFKNGQKNDKKTIKEQIEKEQEIIIESYERLYGALDFSKYKKSLWFAILPFEDANKKFIDIFETLFIHSAQNYNKKYEYDELLNKGKIDTD